MEPTKETLEAREKQILQDEDPLEADERAIRVIGDEFEEEKMEEEEITSGDARDVIQEVPGMNGSRRVIPPPDLIAEGMQTAVRGLPNGGDEEVTRTAEDDEETG